MSSERRDWFTRIMAIVNLAALIIGGIWLYFNVTKPLADVQGDLVRIQTQQAKMEVETSRKPALSMKPQIEDRHISADARQGALQLVISNTGKIPVQLGDIHFRLFYQLPSKEVESLLEPQASNFLIRDEFSVKQSGDGEFYRLPWYDQGWKELENARENRPMNFTVYPGQEYSIYYNYVLKESRRPKWYRVEATLLPPRGDVSWRQFSQSYPIPGHHMPTWEPSEMRAPEYGNSTQEPAGRRPVSHHSESYKFSPSALLPPNPGD